MGVYHCDVKPANVFIERGGRVVMGDFGIARLSESATMTFSTPGTPAYMSPEQCHGGEEVDERTDIYSLGITTYEMLTLDRPFKGESGATTGSLGERVRWEQRHLPPVPPHNVNPRIPPAVETAILRALEKAPERRHQRVLEFFAEFHRAAAVEPAKVLPEVVEKRAQPIEPTPPPEKQTSAGASTGITAPRMVVGLGVVGIGLALLVVLILAFVALPGLLNMSAPESSTVPPLPPPTQVTPTATVPAEPAVVPPTATSTPVPVPSDVYVLYVLDASNSMMQSIGSQSKLAVVQTGLSQHLRSLDPTINAGLLAFGHKVAAAHSSSCGVENVDVMVGMQAGSANAISQLLPEVSAIGKSPLEEAIKTAYSEFEFLPAGAHALILIVDGYDNCAEDASREITDLIRAREEAGQDVVIYVAGLGLAGDDREQLVAIASMTDGAYYDVSKVDDLVHGLDEFIDMIRQK